MSKPVIYFIDLSIANKRRFICDLTEKVYDSDFSVTIFTESQNEAFQIDKLLWSWKQDSFIPHTIENNSQDTYKERVIISSNKDLALKSSALILNDPLPLEKLLPYKMVLDFAEVYDNQKLALSRNRYKSYRDSKHFEIEYLKLGAFLNKKFNSA